MAGTSPAMTERETESALTTAILSRRAALAHSSFTIPDYGESIDASRALMRCVALGGVSVAYRVGFFAHAAPRDLYCRRHACSLFHAGARQRIGRRPVRHVLWRWPETAGAASPGTGEFLCRSVRPQSAAGTARTGATRRRLRTRLLCAKLRRQIFSADHARQRHAGSDVPGVLSRQHHQSVLRQQYRQRVGQQWRALRRQ
jgi:hypothetical protein